MTEPNRTLRAALAYVERGLAVFPLNNKVPATINGLNDATTDLGQIETWFDHTRNIAIAVPAGVVVVDIDPRNGGAETFGDWADSYGWPEGVPEAQTGGDGLHFWFKYDGRKLVKEIGGVDFLRLGKYVVAPPSTTAKPYKWVVGLPAALEDLPEFPGWLQVLATPEEPAFISGPIRTYDDGSDALDNAAHAYTTWESLLSRHGWKEVAKNKWRRPGSEHQSSATIKYDCLFVYSTKTDFPETLTGEPAGQTLYNAILKLDFGDDETRMLQAFRDSGYLDAGPPRAAPGELVEPKPVPVKAAPEPATTEEPGDAAESEAESDDAVAGDESVEKEESADEFDDDEVEIEPRLLHPTDLRALKRKDDDVERRWLIEPIIAVERAHALYAGAKTGKSLLMLPLAAAAATGRPFLDYAGGEPIKVVYADYEMTEDDLKERLESFGYDLDDDLLNEFFVYCFVPASNGLDTPAGGGDFVRDAIDVHAAQLVIVDTLSRAVVGAENDADTVRNFYRYAGWPMKRAGVSVIRLDHAGKDATKGQRGNSAKNDDVDIVWRLQVVSGDGRYDLVATHARPGWVDRTVPLRLHEHPKTGDIEWRRHGERSYPERTKETAELLDNLGAPLDISVKAAGQLLRGAELEPGVPWKGRTTLIQAAFRWRNEVAFGSILERETPRETLDSDEGVSRLRETLGGREI